MSKKEIVAHRLTFDGERKVPTWMMWEDELEKVVSRLRDEGFNLSQLLNVTKVVRTIDNTKQSGYTDSTEETDVTKLVEEIIVRDGVK